MLPLPRQQDIALNLEKIGDLKRGTGDFEAALKSYEEMVAIARQVAATDATKDQWQRNLAISLSKVGDARTNAKDAKGALAAFEEGVAIRRRLSETDTVSYTHLTLPTTPYV